MELYDLHSVGPLKHGTFRARMNRFVAEVTTEKGTERCHVADTGRLTEILTPGRPVLLAQNRAGLKTAFRLLACDMDDGWTLVNTSLHSRIARSALLKGLLGFSPQSIRGEVPVGHSRLDFLVDDRLYVELKGANLLLDGQMRFPDAPTVRGRRHLETLIRLKRDGWDAMILMLALRSGHCFRPHHEMDPQFAAAFQQALQAGVRYRGFRVTVDSRDWTVRWNGDLPLCREET